MIPEGYCYGVDWRCPHCNQPVPPLKYKDTLTRRLLCPCPKARSERIVDISSSERFYDLDQWLESANLMTAYRRGKTLDQFDSGVQPEAFAVAQRYVDLLCQGRDDWSWFAGPFGTGKTHLAQAIVLEMLLNGLGYEVMFCNWQEYLRDVQASWNGGKDSKQTKRVQRMLNGMSNRWFLVIDDLDRAFSQWTINELYTVINRRYERGLPTLITSMLLPWDTTEAQLPFFEELTRRNSGKGGKNAVTQTIACIRSRCREMVGMEVVMKPCDYREQLRSQRIARPD